MPIDESACKQLNLVTNLHSKSIPDVETPRIIGIDDWAYRKGSTYGTVIVDLEKQKIIDLLPDREADTVEQQEQWSGRRTSEQIKNA